MTDISVILPGEFKYAIKFCRQITNLRLMDDLMEKCMFLKLIFDTFAFGTPSSPKQMADLPKPVHFLESTFYGHVHTF